MSAEVADQIPFINLPGVDEWTQRRRDANSPGNDAWSSADADDVLVADDELVLTGSVAGEHRQQAFAIDDAIGRRFNSSDVECRGKEIHVHGKTFANQASGDFARPANDAGRAQPALVRAAFHPSEPSGIAAEKRPVVAGDHDQGALLEA